MPKTAKTKPAPVDPAPAPPKTKAELLEMAIRSLERMADMHRNRCEEWRQQRALRLGEIGELLSPPVVQNARKAAYLMMELESGAMDAHRAMAGLLVASVAIENIEGLRWSRSPDEAIAAAIRSNRDRAIDDRGRTSTSCDRIHDAARDCQEIGRREAWLYVDSILQTCAHNMAEAPDSRKEG